MLPTDFTGRQGVAIPLPDKIKIRDPKEDNEQDILPEKKVEENN